MGREIRRVPVDFQHPRAWYETLNRPLFGGVAEKRWKEARRPMFSRTLSEAQRDWDVEREEFLASEKAQRRWTQEDQDNWRERYPDRADWIVPGELVWASVEDYVGQRPADDEDGALYTPEDWPPESERGWVVYETVSEGCPITPCFSTPDELIDWLATKGTEWDSPMSSEAAERFVKGGWAPSMMISGGVLSSALESFEDGRPLARDPA